MKTLLDLPALANLRVLVRTDFDAPVAENGAIEESFRIDRQRALIDQLVDGGARVALVAHIGAVPSFEPLLGQLSQLVGRPLIFCRTLDELAAFWGGTDPIAVLENVRQFDGETSNDDTFAASLARECDVYINNAFAVCHRAHASIDAITRHVTSYAGPVVVDEVERLGRVLTTPAKGKVIIMGGAKTSTKIPVIKNLLSCAEHLVVGGVVANGLLKERGIDIGASRVDDDTHASVEGLDLNDVRLVYPTDFEIDNGMYMDVGPQSARQCAQLIASASCVVWNGPFGKFEQERFMAGTETIARAIAESSAESIIGGGDTIAAVHQLGILDSFSFVSTGGGAMLAFLAGQKLPGLAALERKQEAR